MREIRACDRAEIGARACRDHQLVVMHALARSQRDFATRMRNTRNRGAGAHHDVPFFAEIFGSVNDEVIGVPYPVFHVVRQPASAVGDRIALFEYNYFEVRIDAPRASCGAQAGRHSADHHQPHQPCFCVLTNSRISKRLISRPGKKLFTASCSSLKISKMVVSLVATSSSTFRRFRLSSFTVPPVFPNAVALMTTAPRPVLSM